MCVLPRRRQNNFCGSSGARSKSLRWWRAGLQTNSMKSCCPLLLFAIAACLFASRRAGCGWGSSLGTPTASAGARFFAAPQGWGILVRHSRTARRSAERGACNLYRREQMRRHRRRTLPLLLACMAQVRYLTSPQPQPRPPRCLEEGSAEASAHPAQRLASTHCQTPGPCGCPAQRERAYGL